MIRPKANRAVIDLESTGNKPDVHEILEFGMAITSVDFSKTYFVNHWLVKFETPEAVELCRQRCHPFVQEMHAKNGLWKDLAEAAKVGYAQKTGGLIEYALTIEQLDSTVAGFLDQYAPPVPHPEHPDNRARDNKPVAFGNNVGEFDLRLMSLEMPTAFKKLHYRTINASSLREDVEGTYGLEYR